MKLKTKIKKILLEIIDTTLQEKTINVDHYSDKIIKLTKKSDSESKNKNS